MRRPDLRGQTRSTAQRVDQELREREREELDAVQQAAQEEARQLRAAARSRRRAERRDAQRFTAARRSRIRAWLLGAGAALVALGVLVGLVMSPAMSVREIRVEGADRVSVEEIQAALEDQMGTPIALVREGEIGVRLRGFAALETFAVDLAPPSAIVIRVRERQPVALTEDGDLIDAAGVNLGQPREGESDLPTVRGVTVGGDTFASVARVLQNLPSELRERVDSVTAETPQSIELEVDTGETIVWGGPEQSTLKSDTVLVLLASDAVTGMLIDVSAPEHPVVR